MFADQIYEKYFAITNPVFELILSMLANFSTGQLAIFLKLEAFMVAHQGSIIAILRKGVDFISVGSLYQLKLITAIFAWIGSAPTFVHRIFPGPGQNSYVHCILELLKTFSHGSWSTKLQPMTDLENARDATISPCTAN